MNIDTSRRALIAGSAAALVAVSLPAATLATTGDAVILAAWERRSTAYADYNNLGPDDWGQSPMTDEESRLWAIIDEAEEIIRSTVARTPEGAAIQLWAMLTHTVTERGEELASLERDLPYFTAREEATDWNVRLILAAIRSLESMGR